MSETTAIWSDYMEWLLGMVNVGVHLVDKSGTTVFFNEKMAEIDGLRRKDVLGRNIFQLFPSLTNENSTLIRALHTGHSTIDQVQTYMNIRGKQITSINSTYPLLKQNVIIGAVELAEDITRIVQLNDQMLELREQLYRKAGRTKHATNDTVYHFGDLIGKSKLFTQALMRAKRAARTHSPVLVCGPTGTGKELIAQSIHNASIRRNEPFIAQNCAAVPRELMEGLLFGTTKGAFTGAIDRPGIFEQAHGGTLFLDEINSLDPALQAKLLRVLQDGRVRRIGGTSEQQVNVRIISAMNADPYEVVRNRTMRSDLFFRLNVVSIDLPPLSQRMDDLPLLIRHFIDKFNASFALRVQDAASDVYTAFERHTWPGNIRELRHAIESAFNMLEENESIIELHHLPTLFQQSTPDISRNYNDLEELILPDESCNLPDLLNQIERDMIARMLARYNGNISRTANVLGLTRQALQYKLKKFHLS